MNESKKTKKLSDGFSSYVNENKAADVPFKVQLTYMANHSLLRNWNLILYIKRFLRERFYLKKKKKKTGNGEFLCLRDNNIQQSKTHI